MLGVGANGKCFRVKSSEAVMFKAGAKRELQIPHAGNETKATHGNPGARPVRFH